MNYCKNNQNDPICFCEYPPDDIKKLDIYKYSPYYCWYSPCFNDKNYISEKIKNYQKYCNVTVCNINIDSLQIDNDYIKIANNCQQSIEKSVSKIILEKPLNEHYLMSNNFFINNFIISVILSMVIFL